MEIHKLRPKDSGKALRVLKLSRSSFHYRSLKDDSTVMMKLEQLTQSHPREGFWKYYYQTYRNQILDAYTFESLDEVRSVTAEFVRDHNYERPHDSLGGLSPVMWKNGQQAQANASTFPARISTSDNNSCKISRKNSTFEAY